MLVSLMAVYLWDNTIFDDLTLPEGMNRETLIHELLHETAELSLLYSDPEEVKTNIKYYSLSRQSVWDHLWALANAEYNPIENYDRTQTTTTQHGHREDATYSNQASRSSSISNRVYGFDSEQPVGKDSSSGSGSGSDSGTNAIQHSGADVETVRGHGNIGVTSYQQMIDGEFEVRQKLDMYKYIINDFKKNFCVMIY